jgi:hypothetical protein
MKEQVEGGKNGEKSHNNGGNVGKDKNSKHPPNDFPPQQHSPMMDHYRSRICFPICNKQTITIFPTSDAKVVGLKPHSLNDILHILKEFEYTLLIIPHLEGYYFIYHLQTCLLIGFVAPMFNA